MTPHTAALSRDTTYEDAPACGWMGLGPALFFLQLLPMVSNQHLISLVRGRACVAQQRREHDASCASACAPARKMRRG